MISATVSALAIQLVHIDSCVVLQDNVSTLIVQVVSGCFQDCLVQGRHTAMPYK